MKIKIISIILFTTIIGISSCRENENLNLINKLKKIYSDIMNKESQEDMISKPINLNGIPMHFRGNLKSNVTLWFISDYYCESCRNFESLYYLLYNKYKTKIRFGHFNISMDSPLKGVAAECAAKQNKYWEMDELLYNPDITDTTDIISIANEIGLDIDQFLLDIKDTSIIENYENTKNQIFNSGIKSTPSIIVNSKIFENPNNISELEQYIEQLL